jgi:hypothetical protein
VRAEGGEAGGLDIGISSRLVIVHDDQQIEVTLKGAGDAADAHVVAAEVTAKGKDVDLFFFDLTFAHERPQTRRHADGRKAAGAS